MVSLESVALCMDLRRCKGIPLITQSDPGSENLGIAKCQTEMRHTLDPTLLGTLQHKFVAKTFNIKSEALWSQIRRQFTPEFESKMEYGIVQGYYDPRNNLQRYIFAFNNICI